MTAYQNKTSVEVQQDIIAKLPGCMVAIRDAVRAKRPLGSRAAVDVVRLQDIVNHFEVSALRFNGVAGKRIVDRALQKLRKAGTLTYSQRTGWIVAVAPPPATPTNDTRSAEDDTRSAEDGKQIVGREGPLDALTGPTMTFFGTDNGGADL